MVKNISFKFKKPYIIAEAGINHNGNIKTAYDLVDVAKSNGADAVKFQTYNTKKRIGNINKKIYEINKLSKYENSFSNK